MSVTASLLGNIYLTDNIAGDTSLAKAISLAYTGTYSTLTQNQIVGTTNVSLTLPGSPVQFIYIRNLSTTTGQNISVTWTPEGGSSENVASLSPGGALFLIEADTSAGVTAISVVGSVSAIPVEYLLLA